ncbi:MAG: DNA starvation/stationary phase protection protein [Thermoanaerobaculia bacterium]|nr:DNA starvation/stationary phase protection protein [Thermoanaerobaculia bacterium]
MAKKEKRDKKKGAAAVVATLQRQQANALVAYLNYKKYHWLSYGPLFRDIHLMLDEQATLVYATIDEFAERAIMVGGAPLGDPADYLPNASVKPSKGRLTLDQMIAEARATLDVVIAELHADCEVATDGGDIGTADLYTRLVQVHQKSRWFLNEILQKRDGLTS